MTDGPRAQRGKGAVSRRATVLLGLLGGMTAHAQSTVLYIHTDALGSPVAVTNAAGALVEDAVHEPFGALIGSVVDDGPGYSGHVGDAATGLNYMQQRYYDARLGLFLSVDPIAAVDSPTVQFHRYRYANNNPYTFVDLDGRDGELNWTARNQVTYTLKYLMTGVSAPFTAEQINAQVARDFSGVVRVNGVDVTVTAQAVQVQAAGPQVNTIHMVPDTAGVTASGRSQTNAIGGNRITAGAAGEDAASAATISHELGGHSGGAGDQYAGGVGANGARLIEDVPGPANIMKDLSGHGANGQTLLEIIRAPTNVNTCAQGVTAANGGC